MGQSPYSETDLNNYVYVVPNSHFWTDLNQLTNALEIDPPSKEYILIGLDNTIKNGYDIQLINSDIKHDTPVVKSVNDIINYINDDKTYSNNILFLMLNYMIHFGYNLVKTTANEY